MKSKLKLKLPDHIQTFLCERRNTLILINNGIKKSIKPKIKLLLKKKSGVKYVYVTSIFTVKVSGVDIKNLKKTQGSLISEIKHLMLELEVGVYSKLRFVGVGYRALLEDKTVSSNLTVKLGLSHHVYFKLNKGIQVFYVKRGPRLTLFGNCSLKDLTQTVASLRKYKMPEPYKGKGILFVDEKIDLKTGKRV